MNQTEIEIELNKETEVNSISINKFLDENFRRTFDCNMKCDVELCLLYRSPEHLCNLTGLKVINLVNHQNQYRTTHATTEEVTKLEEKYGVMM